MNICRYIDIDIKEIDIEIAVKKIKKNIYSSDVHVILSFTAISDIYRSLITGNKTTFTTCWPTQWISKLLGSFHIN